MERNNIKKSCNCNSPQCQGIKEPASKMKKSMRSIPSLLLSLVIAFFPKCPMCWAVYMSMLGSFGFVTIPYMGWLFPVFLLFSVFYLWLLFVKASEKGYGPFILSILGFIIILIGRVFFGGNQWVSIIGMLCVFSGSLWNTYKISKTSLNAITFKDNTINI